MSRRRKNEKERNPERQLKLKECCDMLLAAGYFRVRIANLSPFDKVVGGIVWSILNSGQVVDVDILFQENSTIGQRIKLSEQLCSALHKMKSPAALQPQQIQGLDYDKLYPVVQWLVRKVIETRRLTGNLVRQLAVSQFGKHYEMPTDKVSSEAQDFVETIDTKYKPSRMFRRRADAKFDTTIAQCEATLLEYGEKLYGAVVIDEEKEEKKKEREEQRTGGRVGGGGGVEKNTHEVMAQAQAEEAKRLDALKAHLSEDGGNVTVSGQNVGKFVGMHADDIRKANEEYKEEVDKMANAEDGGAVGAARAEQEFERRMENLKRKIKEQQDSYEEKKEGYSVMEQKVEALRADVNKKTAYVERIHLETKKLEEQEQSSDNKAMLDQLKRLVMLNESLKRQENQFKTSCVDQRAKLLAMIAGVKRGEDDEEAKRLLEVESYYKADWAKLQKLRQVLALKNQEIAKYTRAIDDIPTRAEKMQYERRFVELYELVQDKLVETRKYYEFYNTLNETYQYMSNEEKLLNSISKNFPEAIRNKAVQQSFLDSFNGILGNVDQNKTQVQKDLDLEIVDQEKLQEKHAKLLEKQRKYFKAVKEFEGECFKNEKLSEAVAKLQG